MSNLTLDEIGKLVIDGLGYPNSPDYEHTVQSLSAIPHSELAPAFKSLLEDPDVPLALGIARAIGILGCVDAADLLANLIDEPGKWFGHADRAAIQQAAIHSAGTLKISDSLEPLLFIIKTSRDPDTLMQAVNSIGEIGSETAVDPLLHEIKTNPPVALSAAGALVTIGGDTALQGLIDCLASTDEMVVSAAVWALGKMGDRRAVIPLVRLLGYCEPDLRQEIAWSLGQLGGVKARITLAALSQGDRDLGVRREASRAIRTGTILGCGDKKNRD